MKVISHLAGLSAAATILLQVGTFVEASPFFTETADVNHGNDANIADQCQGFGFTLPSAVTNIVNNSPHAVAWSVPKILNQSKLQLSLVNKDDNSKSIVFGEYEAIKGATKEFKVNIGDNESGTYFYQLKTVNSAQSCTINSSDIIIDSQQQQTTANSDIHSNEEELISLVNKYHDHPDAIEIDDMNNSYDELNSVVQGFSSVDHPNDGEDEASIFASNGSPSENNGNHFDDIINQFDTIQDESSTFASNGSPSENNDNHFDDIINQFDTIQDDSSTFASNGSPSENNDNHFDDIINQFDTIQDESSSPASNGSPSENNGDHFNQLIDQLDTLAEPKEDEVHVNLADVLDDAQNALNNKQSNNSAEEIVDEIAKKVKDKDNDQSKQPHNNDGENNNKKPEHIESFSQLMGKLDQEYSQYIKNNKESKPDNTIHKNSDDIDESSTKPHTNDAFFTNTDLRTNNKNQKRDERVAHTDAAEINNPPTDNIWHTDSEFFTNQDLRKHTNEHFDAEWQEEESIIEPKFGSNSVIDEENTPKWQMNDGYFTYDDQRTPGHANADEISWQEVNDDDTHPNASNDHKDDAEEANGQWAQSHTDANEDFSFVADADTDGNNAHFDASTAWATTPGGDHDDLHWNSVDENANVSEDFGINGEFATDDAEEANGQWLEEPQLHANVNEDFSFVDDGTHPNASNDHKDDAEEANGQWAQSHTDASEDFSFVADADTDGNDAHFDASTAWVTPEQEDGEHGNVHWDSVDEDANVSEDFGINDEFATDDAEEANGQWLEEPQLHANVNEDFSFVDDDTHPNASNDHKDDAEEANGQWAQSHTDASEDFSFVADADTDGNDAHFDASTAWVTPEQEDGEHGNVHWDSVDEDANIYEDFDINNVEQANIPFDSDHNNDINWVVSELSKDQEKEENVDQHNNDVHWNSEENDAQPDWYIPESDIETNDGHDNEVWESNAINEEQFLQHENQVLETYTDSIPFEDHTDNVHWDSEMNPVDDDNIDYSQYDHEDGEWHDPEEEHPVQNLAWATNSVLDDGDVNVETFTNPTSDEDHINEWQEDDGELFYNPTSDDSALHDDDGTEWYDAEEQISEWNTNEVHVDDTEWVTEGDNNEAQFAENGWNSEEN